MKYLYLLLVLSCCSLSWADRHTDLAEKMVELTHEKDYSSKVSSLITNLNRILPEANIQEQDVLALVKKIYESPELNAAKIEAYKKNYTPEELEQLIALVQEPAYRLLLSKQEAVSRTYAEALTPVLQREMQTYIASKMQQQ